MDQFIEDNNPVVSFINCRLYKTNNSTDKIKSSTLYETFKIFAENHYIPCCKFKNILENNGIPLKKYKDGNFYIGVKLKEDTIHPDHFQLNFLTD